MLFYFNNFSFGKATEPLKMYSQSFEPFETLGQAADTITGGILILGDCSILNFGLNSLSFL